MLAIVIVFFVFIAITAYRPDEKTPMEYTEASKVLTKDRLISFVTLNTGYAGLDASQDFFMDGGKGVNPDQDKVNENMAAINRTLELLPADFYFLQEVDKSSSRTYHLDQTKYYLPDVTTRIYSQNFVSKWVPYPLPMIGSVDSGIMTLTNFKVSSSERVSLPDSGASWPKSMFFFKRCFQVSRVPIEDTDKELVLINTHLEAYSEGEYRTKQLKAIYKVMEEEYAKGNYVVLGGDFNSSFPTTQNKYPINPELWAPSQLVKKELPAGFKFAYDKSNPTCRLLNIPYDESTAQFYCIDGYIVSKNIKVESIMTLNFNFTNTDHNPVMMYIRLKDSATEEESTEE